MHTRILWRGPVAVILGALMSGAVMAAEPSSVVRTSLGQVQGLVENGVASFKGIPYGAPPVGQHRFMPPRPAQGWGDVLVATGYGAPAMQLFHRPHSGSNLALQFATLFPVRSDMKIDNEESLFLNLWTPAPDDGKRPVMVWLHRGGYAYGSGSWPIYDGANLARQGDVVVVTVNHRLNAFGYLYLAEILGDDYARSGNAGMLDLVLALEWVRDNAAAFGGDPDNVTIMGQSGGGSKVSHLMAMPAADGLFHKAIIQSGPGLTGVTREQATATARAVLTELGMHRLRPAALRRQLQQIAPQDLLDAVHAAQANAVSGTGAMRLAPVVDEVVLPGHPFTPQAPEQTRDIPLLTGGTKDEMTLFNLSAPWFGSLAEEELMPRVQQLVGGRAERLVAAYRNLYPDYSPTYLYNALLGDRHLFIGSVELAERKAAQNGAPVYVYTLAWETPVAGGALKATHTLDIPLVFANVDRARALTGDGEEVRELERQMSNAWIAFARSGDPHHDGLPEWPAYDAARRSVMVFDVPPQVVEDPKGAVRRILQGGP